MITFIRINPQYTTLTSVPKELTDFRAFEATPGISVIVLPNAPVYTLVAVSNDFISASGMKREDVIGVGHFEVFPQSPGDPAFTGEQNLKASFKYIIQHKVPHEIPIQRYDIPTGDGSFTEKYWRISNAPILTENGEVQYIVHTAIDVTALVKKEQRSQKNIQLLVNNSPVGIVIYEAVRDQKGSITDFQIKHYNQLANELTGITQEQITSLSFLQVVKGIDQPTYFELFAEMVNKGHPIQTEQFNKKTGRWLSLSGTRFEDGFMATLTDITELKQSQEALRKELGFSKSILDASLNGIYVLQARRDSEEKIVDFTLVQANQMFQELTGRPIQDLIGTSFLQAFPTIKESGLLEQLCGVLESGEPYRQTSYYAVTFKRWYEYVAVRLDQDNVVVTFQEITKVRQTAMLLEQQKSLLDSIMKHSPSGITVYKTIRDGENKIVDFQCILANDAAEAFTQISNEERLQKTTLQITPGLKYSQLFSMAVETADKGRSFVTQYHREDIEKWLELSIVKMDDEHLINMFRDITPIMKTQEQLEESVENLSRSNAELEQFAYVSSHDLQEPLRKIRFFNHMAIDLVEGESPVAKHLEKIDAAAQRMSGLITSLLDYSRVVGSAMRFQPVNLAAIVENVLEDYELLIKEKSAHIEVAALPTLEANPLQMNQLFFNLIGNALKFSKRNTPPLITIRANPLSEERHAELAHLQKGVEYIEIVVTDNGIGFNQDYASKIFVIFQRLNDRSTFGGYGIGLAMCKKIVDAHRGSIQANGKLQQGATFSIVLPLKQPRKKA